LEFNNDSLLVSSSGIRARIQALELEKILLGYTSNISLLLPEDTKIMDSSVTKVEPPEMPFIVGEFQGGEARVEIGKKTARQIKGKYVYVVADPLDDLLNRSIDNNIMHTEAVADVMKKSGAEKVHVVFPYCPYVRAHSIGKDLKKGIIKADTLDRFVRRFVGVADALSTIDSHSEDLYSRCEEYGIHGIPINPWVSRSTLNFEDYGFSNEAEAEVFLRNQEPIASHFRDIRFTQDHEEYGPKIEDPVFVCPDIGSIQRTYDFADACGIPKERILILDKDRGGQVSAIEGYEIYKDSPIQNMEELSGKAVIISDDLVSTGGTGNKLAYKLKKESGADRVELVLSHTINPQPYNFPRLDSLDLITALATNDQQIRVEDRSFFSNLRYIHGKSMLLAGSVLMGATYFDS
jgi:phosphoribosylpyrophosphate synthetase